MSVQTLRMRQDPSITIKRKKKKGIYGTASKNDLKELREEGIEAELIPWIENKNN